MSFESQFKEQHEEKRENLIEKIESKVKFVEALYEFALSLDEKEGVDSEQVESELWEKFDLYIAENEEFKSAFEAIKKEKELKVDVASEKARFDLMWSKEKRASAMTHRDFLTAKRSEISEINNDPEVSYLKQITDYIEYLIKLRKNRDKLHGLYEQDGNELKKDGKFADEINTFLQKMYKEMPKGYKQGNLGNANYANYLADVDFRGLGVVLVFKDRAQARLRDFNTVAGRSLGENSISYCFEGEENGFVQSHEYGHTLLGLHKAHKIVYHDRFIRGVDKLVKNAPVDPLIQKMLGENSPEENPEKRVEEYISNYQSQLMGEIFADLGNIFDHGMASGFYGHFKNSMNALERYKDNLKDDRLKEIIDNARRQLFQTVNEYMKQLSELVYLSKKLNMENKAMAAVLVFSGDVRKALRHFKETIEGEKLETAMSGYDPRKHPIFRSPLEKKISEIINK